MSTRYYKLGQVVRSKSCPWLKGMIRRLSPRSATLVTPYGRHRVSLRDLTTCPKQGWAAMQSAPPLPSQPTGKDAR